jgi:hypothetical protein
MPVNLNDPAANPLWILEKTGKNFVEYFHFFNRRRKLTVFTLPPKLKCDPTYTFQPSNADNYLECHTPNTNNGSATYLIVTSWNWPPLYTRRPILKFDMSSQISSGATINSATLSLYYYNNSGDPVGRTYWAYRITQTAWTELGSTWNKYDGTNSWTNPGGDYTTTDGASVTMPASFGWVSWNVKAQVQTAVDSVGSVAHFLIRDNDETSSSPYQAYFYSNNYTSDPSKCPKLYVDWTSGASKDISEDAATVGMYAGGSSLTQIATTTGQQAVANLSLISSQFYSYMPTIPLFQAASQTGQPGVQSLTQDAAIESFNYEVTVPILQEAMETAIPGILSITLSAELGIELFTYEVTIPLLQTSIEASASGAYSFVESSVQSVYAGVLRVTKLYFDIGGGLVIQLTGS